MTAIIAIIFIIHFSQAINLLIAKNIVALIFSKPQAIIPFSSDLRLLSPGGIARERRPGAHFLEAPLLMPRLRTITGMIPFISF
jgi:hypothetical protein